VSPSPPLPPCLSHCVSLTASLTVSPSPPLSVSPSPPLPPCLPHCVPTSCARGGRVRAAARLPAVCCSERCGASLGRGDSGVNGRLAPWQPTSSARSTRNLHPRTASTVRSERTPGPLSHALTTPINSIHFDSSWFGPEVALNWRTALSVSSAHAHTFSNSTPDGGCVPLQMGVPPRRGGGGGGEEGGGGAVSGGLAVRRVVPKETARFC
jgi:hypothetical protein